jgi:DNA-binding NtrC family response regulator
MSVLICDSDANTLGFLGIILEQWNFPLVFASSARQADQMIWQQNISLLVTALEMPENDGLQLAEVLEEDFPDLKIIIYTDNPDDPRCEKAKKLNNVHQVLDVKSLTCLPDILKYCLNPLKKKMEITAS